VAGLNLTCEIRRGIVVEQAPNKISCPPARLALIQPRDARLHPASWRLCALALNVPPWICLFLTSFRKKVGF
jgi:hypothetical protein